VEEIVWQLLVLFLVLLNSMRETGGHILYAL
jgi:hypothetical protein